MSMELNIVRTRFESLDESGGVMSTTFGVRIYDDFGCTYLNSIYNLDELLRYTPEELLSWAASENGAAAEMLRYNDGVRVFIDGEQIE